MLGGVVKNEILEEKEDSNLELDQIFRTKTRLEKTSFEVIKIYKANDNLSSIIDILNTDTRLLDGRTIK